MTPRTDRFGSNVWCPRGQDGFSHHLYEKLLALIAQPVDAVMAANQPGRVTKSIFYCPRDATPMEDRNDRPICPACGLDLTTCRYALIEHFAHRD